MKRILPAALALVILTGCVGVTKTSKTPTPPMPPGFVAPKSMLRAAAAPMAAEAPAVAEAWTVEKLYISSRTNGIYLSWLTNSSTKQVLMAATNITTDPLMWEVLGTHSKFLEDDHWSIQVTNRSFPQRFYKLMSVPTNSIVFGWDYNFSGEPTVVGFRLYEGPASGVYNSNKDINYLGVWNVHPFTGTSRVFYTITAKDTSGIESDASGEVHFAPGDPPTFAPPCP